MKASAIFLALLLGSALLAALAPPAASAGTVRLAVFGDTDTTSAAKRNVDGALADGAQGFVGTGDYYYYSSATAWKDMFRPLTSKGAHMAIGNHDERSKLSELFPEGTQWTRNINGARFVALNGMRDFDPGSADWNLIKGWLCGATEPTKVLVMHHNWWLGSAAHHPGTEFDTDPAAMDKMLVECGVDLVLAGHEHNYQRMTRNGIEYVIVGTGGRGIYPLAGMPSGTVASCACYGRLMLDISADGYGAAFKLLDGTVKDTFSKGSFGGAPAPSEPAPAPAGDVAFDPRNGNEWWVQVDVDGGVTSVEARDTGGAWKPLALKSWGDWAASFHVEPGHDVQYRARTTSGALVESCWYDHPRDACVGAATAPPTGDAGFDATFRNVRGNAWWVETDVDVSGGTLAGVDARVNGGAWTALDAKSWGSWAKSIRAPSGSTVEFRARSTNDGLDMSSTYAWPPN